MSKQEQAWRELLEAAESVLEAGFVCSPAEWQRLAKAVELDRVLAPKETESRH